MISHSSVYWGAVVQLGVPAQVFMAPSMAEGDTYRKPATGMWDFMSSDCNDEIKPGTEQCKDVCGTYQPLTAASIAAATPSRAVPCMQPF